MLNDNERAACIVANITGAKDAMTNTINFNPLVMCRYVRESMWKNKPVGCIVFRNPKNPFYNEFASEIMGSEIFGTAIIVAPGGITIAGARRSWLDLAKKLPKFVPLTAEERERIQALHSYQPSNKKSHQPLVDIADEIDDEYYDEAEMNF
jgi:hypothetical protein